jgi:dimethylaniline monooxygenase (N-oxide forming)
MMVQQQLHETDTLAFERRYDPFGLHRAAAAVHRQTVLLSRFKAYLYNTLLTTVAVLPWLLWVGLSVVAIVDYPNPPATIGAVLVWGWVIGFAVQKLRLFDRGTPHDASPECNPLERPGRVLVVGAGPVGLAVVKECLEVGLEVVAFDRQEGPGGVFRHNHEFDGGVWDTCQLTSSPWVTAFSDFPPDDASSVHHHHTGYLAYLERYIAHFKLESHLHFRHTIEAVVYNRDGGWDVTVRNDITGERSTRHVDFVAICAGLNLQPKDVVLPGMDDFQGEIRHVASYKSNRDCAGKKLIIVGNGESAVDIAADVSRVAEETFLSMRRGTFIIPRINSQGGLANDYDTNRMRYASPIAMRNWYMTHKGRIGFDAGEHTAASAVAVQMLETSEAGPMSQTATKNDDFIDPLLRGRLKVRRHIVRFDRDAVVFSDGVRQEADVVLFAHGYNPSFPFLKLPSGVGQRHPGLLYLRMFMPEMGASLAFCGFARPAIGAIPPTGEMQARYFALVAAGLRSLPSPTQMRAAVVEQVQENAETFPIQAQPNVIISWIRYLDCIAAKVGCRPAPWRLLKHSRLCWQVLTGPMTGAMYRLHGPGARQVARKTVLALPRTHPLRELVTMVGLHFWLWPIELLHPHTSWRSHNTFV